MARQYAWRSIAVKRMNMNTDDGYSMDAVHWFRNSLGETLITKKQKTMPKQQFILVNGQMSLRQLVP